MIKHLIDSDGIRGIEITEYEPGIDWNCSMCTAYHKVDSTCRLLPPTPKKDPNDWCYAGFNFKYVRDKDGMIISREEYNAKKENETNADSSTTDT
jgi:hypothetical protein